MRSNHVSRDGNVSRMELRDFLRAASKRERTEVAVICNDSVSHLYQLAGKHRYASTLMAARIEAQTREVASRSGGRLRTVPLESLVRYPEIYEREEPVS